MLVSDIQILKTGPSILQSWDLRVIYQHLDTPECYSVIGGALWNHCVIRISVWISQALNYWSCQGDHLCMDCEGLLLKRVAPFPFLNSHAYCFNMLSLAWSSFWRAMTSWLVYLSDQTVWSSIHAYIPSCTRMNNTFGSNVFYTVSN